MQPALYEALPGFNTAQSVFQERQWTHHADERFNSNEYDCGQMHKPEPEIAYKAQSHRGSYPDQGQAADNEQGEQEMNYEDGIGQRHTCEIIRVKAKE